MVRRRSSPGHCIRHWRQRSWRARLKTGVLWAIFTETLPKLGGARSVSRTGRIRARTRVLFRSGAPATTQPPAVRAGVDPVTPAQALRVVAEDTGGSSSRRDRPGISETSSKHRSIEEAGSVAASCGFLTGWWAPPSWQGCVFGWIAAAERRTASRWSAGSYTDSDADAFVERVCPGKGSSASRGCRASISRAAERSRSRPGSRITAGGGAAGPLAKHSAVIVARAAELRLGGLPSVNQFNTSKWPHSTMGSMTCQPHSRQSTLPQCRHYDGRSRAVSSGSGAAFAQ